jgi:hypothetical protein
MILMKYVSKKVVRAKLKTFKKIFHIIKHVLY